MLPALSLLSSGSHNGATGPICMSEEELVHAQSGVPYNIENNIAGEALDLIKSFPVLKWLLRFQGVEQQSLPGAHSSFNTPCLVKRFFCFLREKNGRGLIRTQCPADRNHHHPTPSLSAVTSCKQPRSALSGVVPGVRELPETCNLSLQKGGRLGGWNTQPLLLSAPRRAPIPPAKEGPALLFAGGQSPQEPGSESAFPCPGLFLGSHPPPLLLRSGFAFGHGSNIPRSHNRQPWETGNPKRAVGNSSRQGGGQVSVGFVEIAAHFLCHHLEALLCSSPGSSLPFHLTLTKPLLPMYLPRVGQERPSAAKPKRYEY